MNSTPNKDTDAIRSDIDVTRRRMDETMDALGDRLQPRHLLDEVLGFFRGNTSDGENRLTQMREKLSSSADTAVHAVADTVKNNPVPLLLIGAGVAWMIYDSRRNKSGPRYSDDDESYYTGAEGELRYDPDTHYDRPLDYPTSSSASYAAGSAKPEGGWGEGGSKLGDLKDKAASAAEGVKEKLAGATDAAREKLQGVKERAGEKLQAAKERAGEMTARAREATRDAYVKTRERVVTTADQHPLEVGLVALAAGVFAGLALPTPNAVNRTVGPTADRLRDRTRQAGREMMEKGKRVAEAGVNAVKQEAQAQGLSPERLREGAKAAADRAMEATKESAQREGLMPPKEANAPVKAGASTPPSGDPSAARPVV